MNGLGARTGFIEGWRRVAAWLMCVVTLLLAVVVVAIQIRLPSGLSWTGQASTLALVDPFISALVGAFIIDRKGNHFIGWLFCVSGLAAMVYQLAMAYAYFLPIEGRLPLETPVLWSSTWTFYVAFGLAPVLVVYVFPNGRLTSPKWRGFFALAVLGMALGALGSAFVPGPTEDLPEIANPYGVGGAAGEIAAIMRDLSWPLLLVSIAAGVWSLRARARQATSEERLQIKWMLLAGVALAAFVCFWGAMEMLGQPQIPAIFSGLALPLIPLAVGIAILKHRLYDIDLLINRTLVYGILSAILALTYVGIVVLMQRTLGGVTEDSDIAIAASTLAVAALFRPLRSRVQAFIDRRFYRSRYDARLTLESFSSRLRQDVDLDHLARDLTGVIQETMQPAHVSVWLRGGEPSGDNGSRDLEPVTVPADGPGSTS